MFSIAYSNYSLLTSAAYTSGHVSEQKYLEQVEHALNISAVTYALLT